MNIPLGNDKFATVDEIDLLPALLVGTWYLHKGGYVRRGFRKHGKQCTEHLHHFITKRMNLICTEFEEIDHENGDKTDCRRTNLRKATKNENRANRKTQSNNKIGYKGVRKDRNKFVAQCSRKYLGYFDTPEEAARAYDREAEIQFGNFAKLNFPDEV